MVGAHWIKAWSKTQKCVTLSSAEAELVALCEASAETLGILSMMGDFGQEGWGAVFTDSSAALSIPARKGAGKLRHINIGLLWVQEKELCTVGYPKIYYTTYVLIQILSN